MTERGKAQVRVASGDYSSAASIRGRRLIEEIRYAVMNVKFAYYGLACSSGVLKESNQ